MPTKPLFRDQLRGAGAPLRETELAHPTPKLTTALKAHPLLSFLCGGLFLSSLVASAWIWYSFPSDSASQSPFGAELRSTLNTLADPTSKVDRRDRSPLPYHLLLLGLDCRSRLEDGCRTDAILLISFSADRSRLVITSIPRDLWMGGAKINAAFATGGSELLAEYVWEVTGWMPSSFVAVNFDAAVWAIDSLGGLAVDVERGFIDSSYPNDRGGDGSPMTISFEAGQQYLNGEQILQLARSRKGDGGEGSDFQRMRRHQQILKALPAAFLDPRDNMFHPFELEEFYRVITTQIETELAMADVGVLYDLLVNYQNIGVEYVVLDNQNFLFEPPRATYGGAYVLRPKDEDFTAIREYLAERL